MKHNYWIILSTLLLSIVLPACQEGSNIPQPGDNSYNVDISRTVDTSSCTEVTIEEALAIIDSLADGARTSELYKITGSVTQNITSPDDVPSSYSDINIMLEDTTDKIKCYYIKNLFNRPFTANTQVPLVGSRLALIGALTKYVSKSGSVTPEMVNGFICRIDSLIAPKPIPPLPSCPDPEEGQISVSEALSIGNALAAGKSTSEKYKIVGIVCKVKEYPSSQYGNATFYIQDNTKQQFYCYRVKGLQGTKLVRITNPDMVAIGDTVFIESKIMNYSGTIETVNNQGGIYWSSNPIFQEEILN